MSSVGYIVDYLLLTTSASKEQAVLYISLAFDIVKKVYSYFIYHQQHVLISEVFNVLSISE